MRSKKMKILVISTTSIGSRRRPLLEEPLAWMAKGEVGISTMKLNRTLQHIVENSLALYSWPIRLLSLTGTVDGRI